MANQISTYFFIGKFEPFEECKDFNPGELDLGDGWILDIFLDLVCIWKPKVSSSFKEVSPFVNSALALVTALFIFRSKIMLNHRFSHWIEAKEVQSVKNTIGAYISKFAEPHKNARVNVHWKKAAWVFTQVMNNQLMRLALKDYISSLRDGGDDAFFYAYRSIENVCRFVSGAKEQFNSSDWNKMHQCLGTSKSYIDPLTNAATDIRHGNVSGSGLISARESRKQVLDISREVLMRAFKKYYRGYL